MPNEYANPDPTADSAYIAHLWDYPQLTIAIFGVQVHTPEGYALYEAADIPKQLEKAIENAEGLLCVRFFQEGNGGIQFQYWRSHQDLANFAHTMPHTAWWKWLNNNVGKGIGFYHEIFQCKTAEAVYEAGTSPVGSATFCENSKVKAGEGRSVERQKRFEEAGN